MATFEQAGLDAQWGHHQPTASWIITAPNALARSNAWSISRDIAVRTECLGCMHVPSVQRPLPAGMSFVQPHRLFAPAIGSISDYLSDVLRRHISSHDATAIDGAVGPRKRACFECARLRERCTKGQPCSRCYTKSLECIYPVSATSPGKMQNTETGTVLPTGSSRLSNGPLPDGSRGQQTAGEPPTPGTGPVQDPDATRGLHAMHDQSDTNSSAINCETGFGYLENFPVNWLDLDYEMDLDLTSMLGQGFSVTNNPPTVAIVEGSKGAIDPMAMQPSTSWDGPQQIPYPYDPKDATVTAFTPALRGNDHTPTSMSTSCTTNQTPTHTPELPMGTPIRGDFYLDSAVGSRTPCTARFIKRSTALSLTGTTPIQRLRWASNEGKASCATTLFAFPETNHIFWGGGSEDQSFKQTLELGTFREIELQFQRHCCDSSGIFTPFSNHRFLQHRDLQLFLHLYFKHFDPIFPIIHSAVADVNTYWLLAVAACAIGSQYTETQDYAGCVEPLHEFLRRALLSESERGLVGVQELPFQIARSLSYLRGFYSQSCRSAVNTTQNSFPSALGIIEANKTGPDQQQYHHSNSEATIWARDLVTETKSRIQLFQMVRCSSSISHDASVLTGRYRQLLEAMSAYTLGIDNHPISPQVLETSLPNHALWSTASSSEWADCHHQQPLPSLFSAIDTIFRDKSFDSRLCEFGRLILLHGVYSQVGMMQRIHSGPLGNWTPSLREPELETAFTSHEAGSSHGLKPLTSHQLSNWRSAGLDCVDVLHWAANGTIAAASGFENPLVMHLHFSRTLVSAPVSSIQLLATFLASQTPTSLASEQPVFSRDDAAIAEHRIIEWAQRDQVQSQFFTHFPLLTKRSAKQG